MYPPVPYRFNTAARTVRTMPIGTVNVLADDDGVGVGLEVDVDVEEVDREVADAVPPAPVFTKTFGEYV